MSEWYPSEKEQVEIICRVRETDWKWADYQVNRALAEMKDGTVLYDSEAPFGEYGEYLWKRQNYPEIPPGYMLSPKAWRWMTLPEVMDDIFSREGSDADGHRQSLFKAIDDYRFAATNKLLDVLRCERGRHKHESPEYIAIDNRLQVIRNAMELSGEHIPDNPIRDWVIQFLGTEERDEYDVFYEEQLIKKIIVCQGLKVLISKRIATSTPMDQVERGPSVDQDAFPDYLKNWIERYEGRKNGMWTALIRLSEFKYEISSMGSSQNLMGIKFHITAPFRFAYPVSHSKREFLSGSFRSHETLEQSPLATEFYCSNLPTQHCLLCV